MARDSAFFSFGAWVRTRRRQLDLTQAGLAKLASCSEATIRKIEADERKPSAQLAGLLARALAIAAGEYDQFLRAARGGRLEEAPPGADHLHPAQHNLPALLTSTIDRVQDQAAVTALLRDDGIRLVTIIGPPGIGKTRLSIRCGQDLPGVFADGVWFVDLSEVHNPLFFAPAVARALPGFDLPPSPDIGQLAHALENRQLLLILDNFEQIAEGAALQVAGLLRACPSVKLLVTSRLPLDIYGEHEYPLPPLSIPPRSAFDDQDDLLRYESVQLFVARARLHQPHFLISTDNASAIREICTILEGIPLAIELAAATLRQKTLNEISALLQGHNWAGQIGTTARDLPQRQRTLENVIEWSYLLLEDDWKTCYARLGVFSGWLDAEAAAAICETDLPGMLDCLNGLTAHSLLFRGGDAGPSHWRMLELIRAHAYSKLPQPAAIELIRAQYFIKKVKSLRQEAPLAAREAYLTSQLANLHGALAWAIQGENASLAFELVNELEGYWFSWGYLREGLDFCRQLFKLSGGLAQTDQLRLLQISSDLAWQQHDFEAALFYLQQHGRLAQAGGFVDQYPLYLNRLGRIFIEQGNWAQAKPALREALARTLESKSELNPGVPLAQLGEIALFEGDLAEAEDLLPRALAYLDPGDAIFLAMVQTDLAEIALAIGDLPRARSWLAEAFQPAQSHIRRLILFLSALAGYLAGVGGAELAARFYGAIDRLSERSGLLLGNFNQTMNRQRMQAARQGLPADAFQSAYHAGQAWTREDAIQNAGQALLRFNQT